MWYIHSWIYESRIQKYKKLSHRFNLGFLCDPISFQGINLSHKFKYSSKGQPIQHNRTKTVLGSAALLSRDIIYPVGKAVYDQHLHDLTENTWHQTADIPETTAYLNSHLCSYHPGFHQQIPLLLTAGFVWHC